MKELNHQCIAKMYDAYESKKQVIIAMEYVQGGALHKYLKLMKDMQNNDAIPGIRTLE